MLFGIPLSIVKIIVSSFVTWIFLTTVVPQTITKYLSAEIRANKYNSSAFPYDSVSPQPLQSINNSIIYYIIGHPDDEVMFFSPSILELSKPWYNNTLKLACLSSGDAVDPSFGSIRQAELKHSAAILGIEPQNVFAFDNFKDGMNIEWDTQEVSNLLASFIKEKDAVLITFDEKGVSNHSNHISLYYGVKHFARVFHLKMYKLKTLNFLEKYSFTILTNIEFVVKYFSQWILGSILKLNIHISFFSPDLSSVKIYSDLNMLSTSYAAMAYGHFSQMVWFRYGWLVLSRYLTYNNLIQE